MLNIQDEGGGLIEDTFEAALYRARVKVTGRQLEGFTGQPPKSLNRSKTYISTTTYAIKKLSSES
jgi:hypothetical protein